MYKEKTMRAMFISLFGVLFLTGSLAFAETRDIKMVTVDISGTKVWLPSSVVVYKGDKVRIHATTKVAAPANVHGLAIKEFKVVEAVDENGKTIEFIASKTGVFPLYCHLHEAHVGGQLVVLDKKK